MMTVLTAKQISIHSLVKRETFYYELLYPVTYYFNPLPRKEGDHFLNIHF